MLNDFFKQTFPMIEGTKKAKRKPNAFFLIVFFVVLLLIGTAIGTNAFLPVYLALKATSSGLPDSVLLSEQFKLTSLLSVDEINIINLAITGITMVIFLLFCRYFEKRYYPSMGFVRKKICTSYGTGLGIGAILVIIIVFLLMITTSISFKSITTSALPIVIITFGAYMIQGASEEIMLRGFLMPSLAARTNNVLFAVIVNSFIFALLHLANPGIGPISFINLLLFGLFMSIYVLKTGNLWGACAIHTMWNFATGSIFGFSVSGSNMASSIFQFHINKNLWFLNGGSFGVEGGLIVTLILGLSLYCLIRWIQKDMKKKVVTK